MFQKTAISRLADATQALSSYETVLVDDLDQAMRRYSKDRELPYPEVAAFINALIRQLERSLVSEGTIN